MGSYVSGNAFQGRNQMTISIDADHYLVEFGNEALKMQQGAQVV